MPMKTQVMRLEQFNEPLVLRELEIPALTEGQVLVRINAAGVCGSDVHMWKGEDARTRLPMILGHEGVATIEEMKGEKTDITGKPLRTGDRIVIHRGLSCGNCFFCTTRNKPWLCRNRKVFGINVSGSQPPFLNGCYAQHMILAAGTHVIKVSHEVDPAALVAASCSGSMAAHAFSLNPPEYGDTVLIQGPGPIGLYAVAFAKAAGAANIIVIGGSDNRLELCRQFGATMILNRRLTTVEERRQQVLAVTDGRGADVIVEAVGDCSAVQEGLELARVEGTYLSIGFSQPAGVCEVDFYRQVVNRNLKIQGVWVSGAQHTARALELTLNNLDLFQQIVTHRFKLEQATQAIQAMAGRDGLKVVLEP